MQRHFPFALTALALLGASAPAIAKSAIEIRSSVFVEKISATDDGNRRVLAQTDKHRPGDDLLFILRYRNAGREPARNIILTQKVPPRVDFVASPSADAEVSVDGGRSWGQLSALRVRTKGGGSRAARASDVTHVRFRIDDTIDAGTGGKIVYRGRVK